MPLRCPWLRCEFQPASNLDLAQHLFDNPDTADHSGNPDIAPPPQMAPTIYRHDLVAPEDLAPGVLVWRYTEADGTATVKAELPCCTRDRVKGTPGRAVRLPTGRGDRAGQAACPVCRWLWGFQLIDEGDQDFAVCFELVAKLAPVDIRRTYRTPL